MIAGKRSYSRQDKLLPREETLEINREKKSITIGVPKEISFQENRIPLAPQAVGLLVASGNKVIIESNAGKSAFFENEEYASAGADIVYESSEVYKADIILKVAPPTLEEIGMFRQGQTLLSSLHLVGQDKEYFRKLMSKKITAMAFEFIKDKAGFFPVLRAMSEIVGTASVFIASDYLCHPEFGKGKQLGGFPGITPSEVVIIGAGTVAEYSAHAALGMGALVKVFDNSLYRLRRLQDNLNQKIFTSIIQPRVLLKALQTADVVIGALHASEGLAPVVVTEDMVMQMKSGSVILDISIDQGGCVETSEITNHKNPVYKKHGVTHFCVPNIASRIPNTASYALNNFFSPILLRMGEEGGIVEMLMNDFGLRQGVYIFNGTLTKPYIGNYFDLPYQDIELLMVALR